MVQDVNEFAPEWTTVNDDDENSDDENPTTSSLSITVDEGQILEQV